MEIKVKSLIIIITKLINLLNIPLKKLLIFKSILSLKNGKTIYIVISDNYKITNALYKAINSLKSFIIKVKNIKSIFPLV